VIVGVDEIPDPATACYLVLPLLHIDSAMSSGGQAPFELMMATGRARVIAPRPQFMPGRGGIGGGLLTQPLPAFGGFTGREPQLPLAVAGRRRHAITALGRHLCADLRRRDRSVVAVAGAAEHGRQFRIGQHFGGMTPRVDHLGHRSRVIDRFGRFHR